MLNESFNMGWCFMKDLHPTTWTKSEVWHFQIINDEKQNIIPILSKMNNPTIMSLQ